MLLFMFGPRLAAARELEVILIVGNARRSHTAIRMVRPPQREAREGAKAAAEPKARARTTAESFMVVVVVVVMKQIQIHQTVIAGTSRPSLA